MIVEVRKYTVKAGQRDKFIAFFESRAVPALRTAGMPVLGPLLDIEDPDVFYWLRVFSSLEERDKIKAAFYDGAVWKEELEAVAMPMLADTIAAATVAPNEFVNFDGTKGLRISSLATIRKD